MSMSNIISGFRMTGIYPFDRYALRPQEEKQTSIAECNGLKFIPMFTPKPHRSHVHPETPTFLEDEQMRFQKRFEEGYDLDIDERYNAWKRMYHPDQSLTASSPVVASTASPLPPLSPAELTFRGYESLDLPREEVCSEDPLRLLGRTTILSKVLSHAVPTMKPPTMKPKTSARVLTSLENLRALEEKQRKKMELQKLKEHWKKEREENRLRKGKANVVYMHMHCILAKCMNCQALKL